MATRVVMKYLLDDGLLLPTGDVRAFGLDDSGAMAVWLEHTPPVDVDNPNLVLRLVNTDTEFTLVGTYVGTVIHDSTEWHLYNAGPLS